MALTTGISKVLAPYLCEEVLPTYILQSIAEVEVLEQRVINLGLTESAVSYKEFIDKVNNKIEGGFALAHIKDRLREHKHLLEKLQDEKICPSLIVGNGYGNPREVALEWLHRQIADETLEVISGGMLCTLNLSNYAYNLRKLLWTATD